MKKRKWLSISSGSQAHAIRKVTKIKPLQVWKPIRLTKIDRDRHRDKDRDHFINPQREINLAQQQYASGTEPVDI